MAPDICQLTYEFLQARNGNSASSETYFSGLCHPSVRGGLGGSIGSVLSYEFVCVVCKFESDQTPKDKPQVHLPVSD